MIHLKLPYMSPLWVLDDDAVVGFDLSFTRGFKIRGIDNVCSKDEDLEKISEKLGKMLCTIPDDMLLRFYSIAFSENKDLINSYENTFQKNDVGKYIGDKKIEQCKKMSIFNKNLYCFLSTPSHVNFNPLNNKKIFQKQQSILNHIKNVRDKENNRSKRYLKLISQELSSIGIESTELSSYGLFKSLYTISNPNRSFLSGVPKCHHKNFDEFSLRSQIFVSGLTEYGDYFKYEGMFHRVLSMYIPPVGVIPKIISKIQSLQFTHCLCVNIKKINDDEAIKRLDRIRGQGFHLSKAMQKTYGHERHSEMPDFDVAQKQMDANAVLQNIRQSGEKLLDVAIQIWISAPTKEILDTQTDQTIRSFRSCGESEASIEEFRSPLAFMGMIPGNHTLIGKRYHSILASCVADLLPVYQSWTGSENPTSLFITRDGSLVGYNPFDTHFTSWNATIAGATGSGKSFITRCMLNGWVSSGGRVVVVTLGRDYHRFSEILKGVSYDIDLSDTNLALGPFPKTATESTIAHLSNIIESMVDSQENPIGRIGKRIIHKTTSEMYARKSNITPSFEYWMHILDEYLVEEHNIVGRIKSHMLFWLEGPYRKAFLKNRHDDSRLSVWNLQPIHDNDTKSVVLALLSGIIAQSISIEPTIIVMDEVWSIFQSNVGASLIESLYRTVRKEGSAIWSVSQSMSDYASMPPMCRDAILNNSQFKFLLAHEPTTIKTTQNICGLNERETDLLSSLKTIPGQYSEILSMLGTYRQVWKFIPTDIEYWIATSHKKDTDIEIEFQKKHPHLSRFESVKKLADLYPQGALYENRIAS